jgi:hypothetical protein
MTLKALSGRLPVQTVRLDFRLDFALQANPPEHRWPLLSGRCIVLRACSRRTARRRGYWRGFPTGQERFVGAIHCFHRLRHGLVVSKAIGKSRPPRSPKVLQRFESLSSLAYGAIDDCRIHLTPYAENMFPAFSRKPHLWTDINVCHRSISPAFIRCRSPSAALVPIVQLDHELSAGQNSLSTQGQPGVQPIFVFTHALTQLKTEARR